MKLATAGPGGVAIPPFPPHAPRSHGPPRRGAAEPAYARHCPEQSVLYGVVQRELETFLAHAGSRGQPVPRFVEHELRAYLRCGGLAFGFLRAQPFSARSSRSSAGVRDTCGALLAASAAPSRSCSALAPP